MSIDALAQLRKINATSVLPFARVTVADLLERLPRAGTVQENLEGAVAWLVRAHDATADDGVSYGYSLRGGWKPSYRETSGYIAVTFFRLAEALADAAFARRAERICRWLVDVQNADGSFSNPENAGEDGIVFDTGQDLFGLIAAYERTKDDLFLRTARRAGTWLVTVADSRSRWTRNTYRGIPHVYNSRTAWALLRLHTVTADADFVRVARANLDFALENQVASGFFEQCAFETGAVPFTHTIAYAIRGLLESSMLLQDDAYRAAAVRAADAVAGHLKPSGFLPGQIGPDGTAITSYCCLTGNCQMAIVWAKLANLGVGNEGEQRRRAATAVRYVMSHQNLRTRDPNVRGGIKGSHPIWGRYAPFCYPNWATKFFIDALLPVSDYIDA